ncbi:MAG: hypothetical protein QNJ30_17790 [Kiloniellales bacterium]|nr:hypothetical protein [Kiloniellales bacterium]
MAELHAALIRQFPEYKTQIEALIASDPDFEDIARDYQRLREEIHALEASGDVGPDYTNLCNRRDSLQEELVIKMQEGTGG